jgi:Protein of unknown function (DUF3225)
MAEHTLSAEPTHSLWMWIRRPEGWRIVAAHISLLPQPVPAIEKV